MPAGIYERKPKTRICEVCGAEYTAMGNNAKYCPECKMRHEFEYYEAYNARRRKGVRRSDVPDVPADDYDTLAEKIRKTAPIETVLLPKKEDNMDTTREERLKTFPSSSNRLEHPENFAEPVETEDHIDKLRAVGDAVRAAIKAASKPDDNTAVEPEETEANAREMMDGMVRDLAKDRKGMLLAMYDGMTALGEASGMTFDEIIERMSRLHSALN